MDGENELELNGQKFVWETVRNCVTVWHRVLGKRTALIGGSRQLPETVARILARELMDNARNEDLED